MTVIEKSPTKPFVKWAGGKTKLLSDLRLLIPKNFNNYIEPFLGGGAFFFDLQPTKAILSDLNEDLINCYIIVRDNPMELMSLLTKMPVNESFFYEMRSKNPKTLSNLERAARFVYLNKTCYNGLYRVNKKGRFNTPFGHYKKVNLYNSNYVDNASSLLKSATIVSGDFEEILLKFAKKGDFIYLDPPYPSVGRYSDFKRYTQNFFYNNEHIRLAKIVKMIDERGCKFLLSNAKHPLIEELYFENNDFRKIDVKAPRYINCKGGKRGKIPEFIITNIPYEETVSFSSNEIHGEQTKIN